MHFMTPRITTVNQARLKLKLVQFVFYITCFSLFIEDQIYVCSLFLDLKLRHYQGEYSSTFIPKMYEKKFSKRNIVNLQMRKNESTGRKVLKQLFHVLNFWMCLSFSFTQNWNWLQWINSENFGCIIHF